MEISLLEQNLKKVVERHSLKLPRPSKKLMVRLYSERMHGHEITVAEVCLVLCPVVKFLKRLELILVLFTEVCPKRHSRLQPNVELIVLRVWLQVNVFLSLHVDLVVSCIQKILIVQQCISITDTLRLTVEFGGSVEEPISLPVMST